MIVLGYPTLKSTLSYFLHHVTGLEVIGYMRGLDGNCLSFYNHHLVLLDGPILELIPGHIVIGLSQFVWLTVKKLHDATPPKFR
jgi:hypothetical protein